MSSSLVNVFVTSPETYSERRFEKNLSIDQLKVKLERIVGIPSNIQKIIINDVEISSNDITLDELNVYNLSTVKVLDITDLNNENVGKYTDVSQVEKYEMTDKEYENRADTVLAYKKRNEIGRFNKDNQAMEEEELIPQDINVNDRCKVLPQSAQEMDKLGYIRYIGKPSFAKGVWIGVELDEPLGKNDGSVQGINYFKTKMKYGLFVKHDRIQLGDFEDEDLFSDLEEM